MSVFGFHPSLPGWDPTWNPYPYDPDRARELLAEAGFPDGFPLDIYIALPGSFPDEGIIGQILDSYLQEIGIQTQRRIAFSSTLESRYNGKQMHSDLWSVAAVRQPPHETVRQFNYSKAAGEVFSYEHPDLDQMYEQLTQSIDTAERVELQKAMGTTSSIIMQKCLFTGSKPSQR